MICQVLLYGQSYWARPRLEIGRSVPTLLYTAAMLLSVWQPHCFFLRHFIILSASEFLQWSFFYAVSSVVENAAVFFVTSFCLVIMAEKRHEMETRFLSNPIYLLSNIIKIKNLGLIHIRCTCLLNYMWSDRRLSGKAANMPR